MTLIFGFILKEDIKFFLYKFNSSLNLFLISIKQNPNVKCLPEIIDTIPNNSAIIVGHAYGSPEGKNNDVVVKFKNFYKNNRNNIKIIIFSGDVIREPSTKKWEKFYSFFDKDTKIFIAPGNHDLKSFSSEEDYSFYQINHRNQKNFKFPFFFEWENNYFLIEDSNKYYKDLDTYNKLPIKSNSYQNVFVIRHHVLPRSLKFASNNKKVLGLTKNMLKKIDKANKNIYFIYGDGGAYDFLPRIACINLNGIKHLVNGLGDLKGDTILVINEGKIFRKILN